MKLRDAANNLARLVEQVTMELVSEHYGQRGNHAPREILRRAVLDVDQAIRADPYEWALREIERVTGYATDSNLGRLQMLAWIEQAARDALAGKWISEPERAGSFKPGDVLVKAGPFPPDKKD